MNHLFCLIKPTDISDKAASVLYRSINRSYKTARNAIMLSAMLGAYAYIVSKAAIEAKRENRKLKKELELLRGEDKEE